MAPSERQWRCKEEEDGKQRGFLPVITLPCFSCFSASEKGRLVAVFRRFFALRWLRWSRV